MKKDNKYIRNCILGNDNNSFEPVSRSEILKAPITVIYGKGNYSKYNYNRTLKEIEDKDIECSVIKLIEDRYYFYKKGINNWFRKRK